MKVLGLISSPGDPAARVRIIQYIKPLELYGIRVKAAYSRPLRDSDTSSFTRFVKRTTGINEWRISDAIKTITRLPLLIRQHQFNVIWQNRLILPHHSFLEKKIKKPVVFDFDDAIWLTEGKEHVARAIARSLVVFAGNEYLAEFGVRYNKNVCVIPSTADTDRLFPANSPPVFTLGWIGTKSNFPYLDIIQPAITAFLKKNKDARFMVVSSVKPGQFNFDERQFVFREWSAKDENSLINEFSVGLMPLPDDDWTKGKCGYKILQYMACGRPAVVSPAGINGRLIETSNGGLAANSVQEWINAFELFKKDPALYRSCAENGRDFCSALFC
jgi:glycosyltransferase involved in cell wall biosynthesis